MRLARIVDIRAEADFAEKAAKHFSAHSEHTSFTDGDIEPGCFLAIRWGLGGDCVLVLRLDADHIPTNYMNLIRREA